MSYLNAAFKCSSVKTNMVDYVRLAQGGVSANMTVSVNSRGRGWSSVMSQFMLMIYGDQKRAYFYHDRMVVCIQHICVQTTYKSEFCILGTLLLLHNVLHCLLQQNS